MKEVILCLLRLRIVIRLAEKKKEDNNNNDLIATP